MSQHELRVHIAAPSMVREDARWRKIANNIVNFRPARRTTVDDTIADSEIAESPGQSVNHSSVEDSLTADVTSASSTSQTREADVASQVRRRTSLQKRKRDASLNVANNIPFKRAKQNVNPPYKAHIVRAKGQVGIVETPRPRSAPEATILVPQTKSPGHQRSRSDELGSRSSNSFQSSETEEYLNSRVDETSLQQGSSRSGQQPRVRSGYNTPGLLTSTSFERHRFPGNQEHLAALQQTRRRADEAELVVLQLSQTSLSEAELMMGTRRQEANTDDASATQLTESLPRTQDSESTASVSPSDIYKYNSSPLQGRSIAQSVPPPVIDLTEETHETPPRITHRDVLGPVSSPMRQDISQDDFQDLMNHIDALPQHAYTSVLGKDNGQPFQSYITADFANLAQQFDLTNKFRVYSAVSDVKNSTRGYWQLIFSIEEPISSTKSHSSSLTSSQWVDKRYMIQKEELVDPSAATPERDAYLRKTKYPAKDPTQPVPWRAEDFLNFFAILKKMMERGRAGYSSHLDIYKRTRTTHGMIVQLRIFCWGEVLGHTWLLLHGASGGRIGNMPLQWRIPGKGSGKGPILTMSGQPRNQGDVGRWVEKAVGPEGYWGLEEVWDGVESG